MNPANKRPAYLFAKDFKFTNVLGNLQGYKIATGQLEKGEFEEVSKKYGSDEGAVFGSLITSAGQSSIFDNTCSGDAPPAKRARRAKRKRRRKLNKKKGSTEELKSTEVNIMPDPSLLEPLLIPASILAYGSSDSESSHKSVQSSKSHRSSSEKESSQDEDTSCAEDFFGLTGVKGLDAVKTTGEETSNVWTCIPDETLHVHETENPSVHVTCQRLEIEQQEWDTAKIKFKEKVSELSTFKCWKCRRIGHLAEDCTVNLGSATPGPSGYMKRGNPSVDLRYIQILDVEHESKKGPDTQVKLTVSAHHHTDEEGDSCLDTTLLKDYYKRCKVLRHSKHAMCTECGARSNLASCMECGLILCDGQGHLTDHLMECPSHTKLYSFKLKRLIKCCKPSCGVVDVNKLLMCSACLGKQFDSHYNMINATWSRSGLKGIPSTLACEKHFHWHRINCANSSEEPLVTMEKLETAKSRGDGLLSEFYF